MSSSLHDLNRRVDALPVPSIDVADLVRQGETRLRRRRALLAVAATTAIVVAAVGLAGVVRDEGHKALLPAGRPTHTQIREVPDAGPPARPLLYSQAHAITKRPYHVDDAFHYGDRVIETGNWRVHMDLTDDGFVYTTDDAQLWFSNGGPPRRIGVHVCGRGWPTPNNWLGIYEWDSVITNDPGSLVVWFECAERATVPGTTTRTNGTLVVYDTRTRTTLLRTPLADCVDRDGVPPCSLNAVIGDRVYITKAGWGQPGPMIGVDVPTGRVTPLTHRVYADLLRSLPRHLVVGDTWASGAPGDAIEQVFAVHGSRLVPRPPDADPDLEAGTSAFATTTGAEVRLRLPAGYQGDSRFSIFQWLDDDTVALLGEGEGEWRPGDILTCTVSVGRCRLVVQGDGDYRFVPERWLPG
jgi:hypothetical protein